MLERYENAPKPIVAAPKRIADIVSSDLPCCGWLSTLTAETGHSLQV